MKIAEALIQRKELVKKINRLNEEVAANLITAEEAMPAENFITSRLVEITTLSEKLSALNFSISEANAANLAKELNELKTLDSLVSIHQKWRKTLLGPKDEFIYGRQEKVTKVNFSIDTMNVLLEELEEKRRTVDRTLQRRNWEIDV